MRSERIGEWVGWLYVLFFICELFRIHINIRVRQCAHLAIQTRTYVRIKKKRSLNMTYDVLDSFLSYFIFQASNIPNVPKQIEKKKEKRKEIIIIIIGQATKRYNSTPPKSKTIPHPPSPQRNPLKPTKPQTAKLKSASKPSQVQNERTKTKTRTETKTKRFQKKKPKPKTKMGLSDTLFCVLLDK